MVLNDRELDDLVAILTLCAVLAVVDSFSKLVLPFPYLHPYLLCFMFLGSVEKRWRVW